MKKKIKKMTQAQDDAYDRKHGIKEGSKRDMAQDRRNGVMDKKTKKKMKPSKEAMMYAKRVGVSKKK